MVLTDEEHARNVDRAVFPNAQGGPLEHIIAAKAVAFGEALQPEFAVYQRQIRANARALAETQNSGAWAAGDELAYDEIVEPRELRGRLISAIEIATDR